MPIQAEHAKSLMDKAISKERKRKWNNTPDYKHTKLFYTSPDKNRANHILNLSRSHLTKLISIITDSTAFAISSSRLTPTINTQCRLCGEENENFWHLTTVCPRLKTYRDEVFLDTHPEQDNWKKDRS